MKKSSLVFIFPLLILLLASCRNKDADYIDPRGTDYAGAESCIQCHQDVSHDAAQNAHFKASSLALPENVLGNFRSGKNTFHYDKDTKLVMEKRGDSLYQVLYKNGKELRAYKYDIVFGIKNAQTFAYWHEKRAYELPVSYYKSANDWGTSPSFSATVPNFNREIVKDCYSCHSSNAGSAIVKTSSTQRDVSTMFMDTDDAVRKETIVYGIDCERCHGPAKKHVQTHRKFPDLKIAQDIVTFKSLTNQQKLDMCSICHSGNDSRSKMQSRFNFKPGDKFSDYYRKNPIGNNGELDVHGNQNGLLAQSQCFVKSETMNCTTCHSPHQKTKPTLASYSQACISCHKTANHSEATIRNTPQTILKSNCIDCHMPKQTSKAITFQRSGDQKLSGYFLRTHRIAIYPDKKQ